MLLFRRILSVKGLGPGLPNVEGVGLASNWQSLLDVGALTLLVLGLRQFRLWIFGCILERSDLCSGASQRLRSWSLVEFGALRVFGLHGLER